MKLRYSQRNIVTIGLCLFILFVVYRYAKNNGNFYYGSHRRDADWEEERVIPNIVHFIVFGKKSLEFVPFLSILSSLKIQKPDNLYIHTDVDSFGGYYYEILLSLFNSNNTIKVFNLQRPTHVYGQRLSSIYHATDIARIQVLQRYGGIYLDTDMLVLKNFDKFLHYGMVVGWPPNEYIGTQLLMARKDAEFLKLWLAGYRNYHPRDWYYNAGQFPTQQILEKRKYLAHIEPWTFGITNLASNLYGSSQWLKWRMLHAVHLLSRHPPAPQNLNENFILHYRSPFGDIARWLLFKVDPKINFPSRTVT